MWCMCFLMKPLYILDGSRDPFSEDFRGLFVNYSYDYPDCF